MYSNERDFIRSGFDIISYRAARLDHLTAATPWPLLAMRVHLCGEVGSASLELAVGLANVEPHVTNGERAGVGGRVVVGERVGVGALAHGVGRALCDDAVGRVGAGSSGRDLDVLALVGCAVEVAQVVPQRRGRQRVLKLEHVGGQLAVVAGRAQLQRGGGTAWNVRVRVDGARGNGCDRVAAEVEVDGLAHPVVDLELAEGNGARGRSQEGGGGGESLHFDVVQGWLERCMYKK